MKSSVTSYVFYSCRVPARNLQSLQWDLRRSLTSTTCPLSSPNSQRKVALTVRSDTKGGKRLVRLQGTQFVRRFMLHTLPTGIKRIRHFGVCQPKIEMSPFVQD